MDCSTTIERRETCLIAELFLKYGLITMIQDDKSFPDSNAVFQPSKYAIYCITERGQRVCGWIARDKSRDNSGTYDNRGMPRDSNNARLTHILQDPALRLLFREFLRYSLCEENLSFYLDVSEFTTNYHKAEKTGTFNKVDSVRETLAAAYGTNPPPQEKEMTFSELIILTFFFFSLLRSVQRVPGSWVTLRAEHRSRPSQQPGQPYDQGCG
jgi:hypothetical protein